MNKVDKLLPGVTYVTRDGELVPKHLAPPLHVKHGRGPAIHCDFSGPVLNHADGKRYTSKRHYYDAVKAHGCRVVGNDLNDAKPAPAADDPSVKADVEKAYGELNT